MAEPSSPLVFPESPGLSDRVPATPVSAARNGSARRPRQSPSAGSSGHSTPILPGTPGFGNRTPNYFKFTGGRAREAEPQAEGVFAQAPVEDPGSKTYVWGTNISIDDTREAMHLFFERFRESPEAVEAKYIQLLDQVIELEGRSLNIDAQNIFTYNEELYSQVVRYPLEVIPLFDMVVGDIARERRPDWNNHIQARIFNLKLSTNLRDLNPSDIEKLVSVKGMIIRCSSVIPEIKEAFFQCLMCGHFPEVTPVDRGRVNEPSKCANPACSAVNSMTMIHNRCTFTDKQIVRLQETPDAIPEGETPHTVSLLMHDKLVDAAKPGDRVEVTGVFRAMAVRVGPNQRTLKSLYKTYIDCLHVKKADKSRMQMHGGVEFDNNEIFLETDTSPAVYEAKINKLKELSKLPDIYQKLTRSLAPSIWELEDIKKGLLCQLFGGSTKKLSSGASFRGDINVLLVGDPGTSKSQLLQYVHKIAPRGIYTSGRGSSAVGLTAYVTKDPETRETVLESGALVLSDQGICCIDEFDKMSENARSMLHEVMEQQTVSVAKAGIIATLNARTSVLACANPSGSRYNARLSVIDNIQLPPTLLSRFDLIYLVLDKPDEQTDRRLARHLVALHYEDPEVELLEALDLPTIAAYITYARQRIHPKLSNEAAERLIEGYVNMRRRGNFPGSRKKVITATPRQLESLIRISEALARMRFSETVDECDTVEALRLLDVALQQSATDHSTGIIDMDLITTGVSASERTRRENVVSSVKVFIMDRIQAGSSLRITELFEDIRANVNQEMSLQDLKTALNTLMTEGFVSVLGDNVARS
ncbi:hypothetical protein SELMODRAFT_445155 [Selaginella moellendorffii]|uniref:DNA replication licensing factor MCM4 n=1 Tax=Selaginella moellendorffii TaxID=88036 RepID=D8SG89_SELML|nr:hypothetical protein SELMODRAFT_445155 [Selaginella moellendorffii]